MPHLTWCLCGGSVDRGHLPLIPDQYGHPGRSIPDIMSKNGIERIDFLKIDIEGAEVALFDLDRGGIDLWLPHVTCFSLEVSALCCWECTSISHVSHVPLDQMSDLSGSVRK